MPSQSASPLTWIHQFDPESLTDHQYRQAKRCLLDLLGVAAGSTLVPLAQIATRYVTREHAGARPLLFSSGSASASGAALHGAWLIDALDAHDGQVLTKGHCGVSILPALIALPEAEKLSGKAFLGLLVLGYEVATRCGIALHRTAGDYHTSGAWNSLAVAAVAAHLLRLDQNQLHEAMGVAEFYGPRSQMMRCIDHPTMVKDGSGWGAHSGMAAALLAQDGFTGAPAVTVTDDEVADIWADLGEKWWIMDQYFKPYPVCRWAQPAVESVLSLCTGSIDISAIQQVTVYTFHEAKRLHVQNPDTTEQAQYSLPWSVACVLKFGTVNALSVSSALSDRSVHALSSRIKVVEYEAYNERFPAERWAEVKVEWTDGTISRGQPSEARGNPTNPLTEAEISEKFYQLAVPAIGKEQASRISEVVSQLERRPASDLLTLLAIKA